MKKVDSIILDIAIGVRKEMESAMMKGAYGMHFEKSYGNAYIDVDIFLERKNNYIFEVQDVMVSHVETLHKSPLLEQAVKRVLPSWFKMQNELMMEERQTA